MWAASRTVPRQRRVIGKPQPSQTYIWASVWPFTDGLLAVSPVIRDHGVELDELLDESVGHRLDSGGPRRPKWVLIGATRPDRGTTRVHPGAHPQRLSTAAGHPAPELHGGEPPPVAARSRWSRCRACAERRSAPRRRHFTQSSSQRMLVRFRWCRDGYAA